MTISVLGAGAFGSALAISLAKMGANVIIADTNKKLAREKKG